MTAEPVPQLLLPSLKPFLARQRWFAGNEDDLEHLEVVASEELFEPSPAIWWLLVRVGGVLYQVLIGMRPSEQAMERLSGHETLILGDIEGYEGSLTAYDALVDADCCIKLLQMITDRSATRARMVTAEQSNSSVVFDDQVILKLYRRPEPGRNPDAEISSALDAVGFNHLAAPIGTWRRDDLDLDLALAQEYLSGGTEGWALALTSLRDLLGGTHLLYDPANEVGSARDPLGEDAEVGLADPAERAVAMAGGDFADEARRLGETTGKLHAALAQALGSERFEPYTVVVELNHQLDLVTSRSVGSLPTEVPATWSLGRLR